MKLFLAGGTDINEQIIQRISLGLFFIGHDVVSPCSEDSVIILAIFRTNSHRCSGQDLFRYAADPIHIDETIRIDTLDDTTDRIHVGKDHQRRRPFLASLERSDDIADAVDLHFVAVFSQIFLQTVRHFLFIAGDPRYRHVFLQLFFQFFQFHNGHLVTFIIYH